MLSLSCVLFTKTLCKLLPCAQYAIAPRDGVCARERFHECVYAFTTIAAALINVQIYNSTYVCVPMSVVCV